MRPAPSSSALPMDRQESPLESEAPAPGSSERPRRSALRIALWYALFGAVWILVSDRLLIAWTRDPDVLGRIQTAKGWLYVGVSAVFVYLLAARAARVWSRDHARLRRARERLETAQRIAGLGHWTLELATQRVHGSREFFRLVGLRARDDGIDLDELLSVVHPDDRDRIGALHTHRRTGDGDGEAFHRIVLPDGGVRWVHERAHAERDDDGKPVRLVGTTQDITELRRSEREARDARDRLEAVVQASPVAILVLDGDTRVLRWNPAAEATFGWSADEVLGRPVPVVSHEQRAEFEALFRRVREGETLRGRIVTRTRRDGSPIDLSLSTSPLRDPDGRIVGSLALMEDVSHRIRAAREVEATRQLLQRTFESLGEAVFIVRDRRIVDCNTAAERVFGHPKTSLVGSGTEILHVDRAAFEAFARSGEPMLRAHGVYRVSGRMRRADGTTFPSEHTVTLLDPEQGVAGGVVSVVRDVTDRQAAEDQRKRFYEHLQLAREEERKRLSREVHDELGQALTGLKMDLARLASLPETAGIGPRLEDMDALVDQAIRDVRRIATELRPGILDDFGLVAALEWLCDDVSRRTGLPIAYRADAERVALDDGRATQVFRVAQEALTNIVRHAGAERASLRIGVDDGTLLLEVEDDGRGMAPRPDRRRRGLGLVGMAERAEMLSGTLVVDTEPERGTRIALAIPLERRRAPRGDPPAPEVDP